MKLKYRYNKAEFEEQLKEEAELNKAILINFEKIETSDNDGKKDL